MRVSGGAIRTGLAVAAGAALTLCLLGRGGGVGESAAVIRSTLSDARPAPLGMALLLFFLSQVFRAWRWKLLSWDHPIAFGTALPLNAVHVGLGHLLPLRLADPLLVGLFRRYGGLSLGRGAATVLLSKFLDMAAMGILAACAVAAGLSGSFAAAAAMVGVGSLAAVFLLPTAMGVLRKPLMAVSGGRFSRGYDNIEQAVRVGAGRRGRFSGAFGLSLGAWTLKLFMFVFLLRALGVEFRPVWKVLVAGAVTDATLAMPVHGLMGMGTLEAGWTAGFAAVGVTGELAPGLGVVQAGFSMHLLWMTFAVIFMAAAWLYLLLFGRKAHGR